MTKFASPMRMTSPSLRLRRASSASSTAAPNTPSRSPSASVERHGRREDGMADTRPRRLDSLDFDQRRVAARRSRHAAQGRNRRQRAMRFEKALLVGGKAAMDERERCVAAQDHASFAPHAVVERAGEAFHADDRRDAKRDAEKKDAQARQTAAQVAQGEAQGRRAARLWNEPCRGRVHSLLPRGERSGTPFSPGRRRRTQSAG